MGFLWEGSTGARALKLLKELPQGQGLRTPDLAQRLGVTARALHQLLANAVRLRLVKKVYPKTGGSSIEWRVGAGGDSVTIERRREPVAVAAPAPRRRTHPDRPPAPPPRRFAIDWPPGFASSLAQESMEVLFINDLPVQLWLIDPDVDELWSARPRRRRRGQVIRAVSAVIDWHQLTLFDA